MRALWISSDFWNQPATGGARYTGAVMAALRKSAVVALVRVLVGTAQKPTPDRKAAAWLRSMASGRSTLRIAYSCPEISAALAAPDALTGVDMVVLNGEDQSGALDLIPPQMPIVYIMHNLETDYARVSIEALPGWQRLMFALSREHAKRVREEARILDRASLIIGISVDELEVASEGRSVGTCWFPPTFGQRAVRRRRVDSDRVVVGMLGGLDHFPNRASLDFFLREAWPHADARARLLLAGRGTETFTDERRRITGTGLIPDVNEFWSAIDVLAAPILHGAGTNVKICEALWNRVPMLVSPLALRGLPKLDDPAVQVLTNPADWRTALQWARLTEIAAREPAAEIAQWFHPSASAARLDRAMARLKDAPRNA